MIELKPAINEVKLTLKSISRSVNLGAVVEPASGSGVPTNVREAIYTLLNNAAYATTGLEDEIAIVQNWAQEVTALSLDVTSLTLNNDTPQTITATVVPSGSTITWTSSDNSVATVVGGVVTGVSNGSCVITASAGSLSANCSVTVSGFATLESISAVYTQSGTVKNIDTLDSLKTDLVVTATYSDSSTATIPSTDYELSGTLTVGTATITVTYRDKTTTFNVTVTDSGYLYYWDFTDSLVDRVNGTEATLWGCERTDNGVTFDGGEDDRQHIRLDNVFGRGKQIEVDLKNVSLVTNDSKTKALIWLWNGSGYWVDGVANVFGYHYSSTSSTNRYGIVNSDSTHWGYPSTSSVGTTTYLNGNCTVKLTIDSSGNIDVYKDGTNMNIKYNNAKQTISDANAKYVTIGSPASGGSYNVLKNATITGVRIKNL